MKIEVIKVNFDVNYPYDDGFSYKYKPFKYCCGAIQNDKAVIFTDKDLVLDAEVEPWKQTPCFCTSHTKYYYYSGTPDEETVNYPIQFCPHCGEKIEVAVVDEIDVSKRYDELSKLRNSLWEKCQRTDSKKEESELKEQVRKLDDQINDFYEVGEWKAEYLYKR